MTDQEAAEILASLAERQAHSLAAALEVADDDQKALIRSSGDLDVLEALRRGSRALSTTVGG